MVKNVLFWIFFPIISLLISALLIFYLDLANGPLVLFIIEIIVLVAAITMRIILRKKRFVFRMIPFLSIILIDAIILPLAKPTTEQLRAVNYPNVEKTEVMHLANGDIQGVLNKDKDVEVYAGIPYAKAPVGDLRWKEPQDVENWDGVKDCSYFAPKAMQDVGNSVINTLVDIYSSKAWHPDYNMEPNQNMSEDCLYLNIWKPHTNETNLPILIYIHGGSLKSGSSAFSDYNGESMAKKGVIMITIAYRLGVLGYFANESLKAESIHHTTGNYGLLDQIKALEWVNNNAAYFNGNKDNITIAGESAGSSCVSALCTSPLAKNLFKRAIGESSSLVVSKAPHTYRTYDEAIENGNKIMEEFNCHSIEELRKIPAESLVNTKYQISEMTLDGYALEKNPYDVYLEHNNNEEALLNGYNVKEADAFVVPTYLFSPTNKDNIKERLILLFGEEIANKVYTLYEGKINEDAFTAFNEIYSVLWFINPHHSWSNMAINSGVNVYRYQFTKDNKYHDNYHAGELIYAYGNVKNDTHGYRYDDIDLALSETMLSYWANFAKNGNPNGEGLPTWNQYQNNGDKVMELGRTVGPIDDKYLSLYPLIEEFNQKLLTEAQ